MQLNETRVQTWALFSVVPLVVCFIAACSSYTTMSFNTRENPSTTEEKVDPRINGLIYYLPKGRLRIVGAAGTDKSSSQGSKTDQTDGKNGDTNKDAAAPKTGAGTFAITISVEVEADPSQRFYLKPDRNYFYDDNIHLATNPKQLLSSGSATATDETTQIIATSAQIVASAFNPLDITQTLQLFKADVAGGPLKVKDLIDKLKGVQKDLKPGDALLRFSPELLTRIMGTGELGPLGTLPQDKQKILDAMQKSTSITFDQLISFISLYNGDVVVNDETVQDLTNAVFSAVKIAMAPLTAKPFNVVFDCDDLGPGSDFAKAQGRLKLCGFDLEVKAKAPPDWEHVARISKDVWHSSKEINVSKINFAYTHGIVFRPLIPYEVSVSNNEGVNVFVQEDQTVMMPDTRKGAELVLDYSRMPFVTKNTNIVFTDGTPQDFSQSVPSPVLGFLGIPKAIISAILPIPTAKSSPSGVQDTSATSKVGSSKTKSD